MRQVFRMRPWIFPPEPQAIQEIFVRYGVIRDFAKGAVMEHGGKGDAARLSHQRIGHILLSGRAVADAYLRFACSGPSLR